MRLSWLRLLPYAFAPMVGCGVYDYELGMTGTAGANGGVGPSAGTGAVASSAGRGGASGGEGGAETGGEGGAETGGEGGGETAPSPTDLVGWAAVADCGPRGTTGGELGPTLRPSTAEGLDDAVRDLGPSVIEIVGKLDLGDMVLQISGDKTLIGVQGAELVGSVRVRDARNVILRNLKINGGGVSNTDALEIDNSACVWVDHCEIFDGGDSNLDIVRGSDLVTVSWSKLYYLAKTDEHRLGSVCGNSNTDWPGRINVTFHHNWWADGVLLNMPSVRHGKVHVFNNYFSAAGNDYCISAGYMARLLVQNNVFDGVNDPIVFGTDEDTAEVVETGNDYANATGSHVNRGTSFEPPYAFVLDQTASVADSVRAGTGVR